MCEIENIVKKKGKQLDNSHVSRWDTGYIHEAQKQNDNLGPSVD